MLHSEDLTVFIDCSLTEMPLNKMQGCGLDDEPVWQSPLVGYASGDDDLFAFFKQDIGSFYWLPEEAFALKYGRPGSCGLTVMSLAFPQTEKTREEQRENWHVPGRRWAYSRQYWPDFTADLSDRLISWLGEQGIRAVDPERLPEWQYQTSARYGYASNWSQRHTAYTAGLGTFGLSDGLITERGKAMRFMSLILEISWPPTPRRYTSHQEWCPYFRDRSCGLCIERCPANAISAEGHDKDKCAAYCRSVNLAINPGNERTAGCGLCQTAVPCESRRPD